MQPQTSDEENKERNIEIDNDYNKAKNYPDTIIGRKRLRGLRVLLGQLGIELHVPMNSAAFTDEYCKKYGKKESNHFLDRRKRLF